MIESYSYVETQHHCLHNGILTFFERIEFEHEEFSDELFEEKFLKVAKRHKSLVYGRLKRIYTSILGWSQEDRSKLINQIRDSNRIEEICSGYVSPTVIDDRAKGVYKDIRELFIDLYEKILDGKILREEWGIRLKEHYDYFREKNSRITICPLCGINHLKMQYSKARDPYDHYLPKSLYPFSSVNFRNLVPTCTDCNSIQVKGNKDIVQLANGGAFFYPFDSEFSGIKIVCELVLDENKLKNTKWNIKYISDMGYREHIKTWKKIYSIDTRHKEHIRPRIEDWLRSFIGVFSFLPEDKLDEILETYNDNPLKCAVLTAYTNSKRTLLERAIDEAAYYS